MAVGIGNDRGLDVEPLGDGAVAVGYTVTDPAEEEGEPDLTDAWIRRLGEDGGVRWTVHYDRGSGDSELASGVAVDGTGRVAVAGAARSEDEDWDIWVAVYDPEGALQWETFVGGDAQREDQGVGIAVTTDDEFVVAGYQMASDGTTDAWVRRFGADGDTRWTHTHDGPAMGVDVATDLAVDPSSGDVIVVGYQSDPVTKTDIWLRRLSGAGDPRWTTVIDGPASGNDRGAGVAITATGAVVAVGSMVVPQRTIDAWVGGLSSDGVVAWEQLHDGPASLGDGANDVAAFPDGGVVVAGFEYVEGDQWDVWARRLDADGETLWTHRYAEAGLGDDLLAGVSVDTAGDVLALGSVATADGPRGIWLRKIAG